MLNKLQKIRADKAESNQKGFTIIEVMIVLAIAGLIILIVFLAVPALQRNSRNTQRKSDIGRIGSAITTVASNNNGDFTKVTSANTTTEAGTLGYYDTTVASTITVTAVASTVTTATAPTSPTKDTVVVQTNAKCSGTDKYVYANRSAAIFYATETGGADAVTCISQ